MAGAAAARRASGGATPSASLCNLLIIGALMLLVVVLAAERSTVETTRWGAEERRGAATGEERSVVEAGEERRGGATGEERSVVKAAKERRGGATGGERSVVKAAKERRGGATGGGRSPPAAAKERRGGRGAGTAAVVRDKIERANKVRMIHVGKTGGQSVAEYLDGAGFSIEPCCDADRVHAHLVGKEKVRETRRCPEEEDSPRHAVTPQAAHPTDSAPVADTPPQPRRLQLLKWLRRRDIVTFVSVRDPSERAESAYNWRKHKCRTTEPGMHCSHVEQVFYQCYTTLNAFSEGSCDGSMCGDGWDEKNKGVKHAALRGYITHSCEDAWRIMTHGGEGMYQLGTWLI